MRVRRPSEPSGSRSKGRLGLAGAGLVVLMLAMPAGAAGAFGFIDTIGTAGPGPGEFFQTRGVAVDGAGNLVVAEDGNNRVQIVQPDGTFVDAFGSGGSGSGQFGQLWDVAVGEAGNFYTAESDFGSGGAPDRIQKFDPTGAFVKDWNAPAGPGSIFAVAANAAGTVFVASWDHDGGQVLKFDSLGTPLPGWGSSGFGAGQFRNLTGITVDGSGNVYTVEGPSAPDPNQSNRRVQKFDSNGTPLNDFQGGTSSFPIGANGGSTIDVDAAGNIYVAGGGGLVKYSPAGIELARDDTCGVDLRGVAAHPNGNIYTGAASSLVAFGEGGTPCAESPINLSFSGKEGVSVNNAARFTNDPDVVLNIVSPGGASKVLISNDGGFAPPLDQRPIADDGQYPWTLDRDPDVNERLPKTVYVRFGNDAVTSAQTFTDDIILDTVAPQVSEATIEEPAGGASVAAKVKKFTLKINAKDKNSGVSKVQTARNKANPHGKRAFKRKLTIRAKRAPRYVRVFDRAKNHSKWRKLKRG